MGKEETKEQLIEEVNSLRRQVKELEGVESSCRKAEKEISIFHRFAETAGQGFGMATLEGKVMYVNPALCRMFDEEKPEDCYKKNISDYYSAGSYKRFVEEVHSIVQDEGKWEGESVLRSGKGREFPVIENIFIIKDEEGKPEYYANTIVDITEIKKMQEETRGLEEYLQLQFNRMPIGLIVWDKEFRVKTWNPAATEIFGFTAKEAEARHAYDLIVPKEVQSHVDVIWSRLLAADETAHSVNENVTKDGRTIVCSWANTPLKESDGTVVGVLSMVQNITEKKEAEEEIQNLAKFPSENPSPVLRVDKDGKVLYANESAEGMLKNWNTGVGKNASDTWTKLISEAIRTGEDTVEEAEVDGRIYSVHVAPVIDGGYANLYAHDITQRKRAEEELRDSESFLQSIFDGIQDGINILDKDMNVVKTNLWMKKMYSEAGPLIGKKCYEVYQKRDSICPWCSAVKTIETGEVQSSVVPYPSEEKPKGWILLSSYPFKDSKGNMVGVIEHVKDITDKKKAELELETYRQHLEELVDIRTEELGEANKELEAFSYCVSHDLRAPLRSMDGFSQIILEDYQDKLDEDAKGYLHRIREASQRMAQLIEDILMLSRVTRHEIHKKDIDISSIAKEVIKDLKSSEPKRKVDFTVNPKLKTKADDRLMKIVLENLIGNAWKFTQTRPGAKIEVGCMDLAGERAFFVKDSGVGFNMAYADKLFGPFQRLHSEKEFPGTGIGLASVKRIITRHGGRIWADSKVGKGATFYFTIPNK
ncbi:MAG: PAS domain S-box protein [Candidatus Omnitrophota bacterium]